MVLLLRARLAMSERELHSRVAIGVEVEALHHRHGDGPVGGEVERGVELPVQISPGSHVAVAERGVVLVQNLLGALEVLVGQEWNRSAEQNALEPGAQSEELFDVGDREGGDHRSSVRAECDEPFGLELAQRFPHGDPADAEIGGEHVLAQLFALGVGAVEDALADAVESGRGYSLPG